MVLSAVPLVAVTGLFIGIFSYCVIRLQIEEIRANWQERRCDPFVIPLAHMIPTDPSIDPTQFSAENFQYCMNKIVDSSIALATAPMQKGFMTQIEAIGPIHESMNYLRSVAKGVLDTLQEVINNLWKKVTLIAYQFIRVFTKLSSAFDRIFGIAVSSIFAGIGMYRAVRNALNFVIYVVLIILAILLAILIFAFFLMIPVMPVILTTIGVISASVFGATVGGMSESFCVAPGTLVAVKDGWKKVEEIKPGDSLDDGNGVVEGVLHARGVDESFVTIDGIIIASCHIVWDGSRWIHAGEHPLAQPYRGSEVETVYCLNTSSRTWRVKGDSGDLVVRDWEELPLDPSMNLDAEWEGLVHLLLNPQKQAYFPRIAVPGRGLLGKNTLVYEKTRGPILLSNVCIGDSIRRDIHTPFYTKVLAVYQDIEEVHCSGASHPAWVWGSQGWAHPPFVEGGVNSHGYHLITDSGVFLIEGNQVVRDFTEVGLDKLGETYSFVLAQLSNMN